MSVIRGILNRAAPDDDGDTVIALPKPPIEKLFEDLDLVRSDQASALRRLQQLNDEEARIIGQIFELLIERGIISRKLVESQIEIYQEGR